MEVETKILEINVEETRKKIEALGAKQIYDALQESRIFEFPPDSNIASECFLRVRKIGDKVELTYKGPKKKTGNVKSREEIETHVEDFDRMIKILKNIGFVATRSYKKHRIEYKLGKISFEIDNFPDLPVPPWLEIEAPSKKEAEETARKLGFKKEDMKSYGGTELLAHYNIHTN